MEMDKERLTRLVEHGLEEDVTSPMDPPKPYDFSKPMEVPFEELSPILKSLVKEHEKFLVCIDKFEKAILAFKDSNYVMSDSMSDALGAFFRLVDEEMVNHHAMEEKILFPPLRDCLIQEGECSPGKYPRTAIELMESEHLGVMQSASLVFNLIGIGSKIQDQKARDTVFHHAVEQAKEMIEELRLHIFKENQVIFPQAQKLLTKDQLSGMADKVL